MDQANKLSNSMNSHERLKYQLRLKFAKLPRSDEKNQNERTIARKEKDNNSIGNCIFPRKYSSPSILLSNRLTKSDFSLRETGLKKVSFKESFTEHKASRKVYQSHQRKSNEGNKFAVHSPEEIYDREFFKTRLNDIRSRRSLQLDQMQVRSARESLASRKEQLKFKLIFKEPSLREYRHSSERNINRLDSKIAHLKRQKTFLSSLLPEQPEQKLSKKTLPKGMIVPMGKITKMVTSLVRAVEMYFNMYVYDHVVGGHLKKVEGYNQTIEKILMADNRAKRLNVPAVEKLFWVFKATEKRSEYFGEEDQLLYNTLNNYLTKMESKQGEVVNNYNRLESEKVLKTKSGLALAVKEYRVKFGRNEKIDNVIKFIETRKKFDQRVREQTMQELQKRGMRLNIIERSKDLIVREKEQAMKQIKVKDLVSQ